MKSLTSHDVANHFDGTSSQVENLMNSLLELKTKKGQVGLERVVLKDEHEVTTT